MILEQIKSEGISQNSYLVGSGSDAAVVDPRRDCRIYVDIARRMGMKIRYIFETHRHEDFVVGSVELGKITGAEIWHGPRSDWKYGNIVEDGRTFRLGDIKLTALSTPGHTDESMSYAVTDLDTGPSAAGVFTGDTLFVGEVGRADLYGPTETPRMASNLYDSIFGKLLPLLGDGVIIYPAHGGGSVCGASIADRETSTIGIEKAQNPVLQLKGKDAFIKYKLAEKLERPYYFTLMEKYNLEGPPLVGLAEPSFLSSGQFQTEIGNGALVVDTREPWSFGGLHIANAYNIWLEGLPAFAGWMLPYDKPLLLVLEDPAYLDKAVRYLYRAGYDNVSAYLKGGMDDWSNSGLVMRSLSLTPVHQLKQLLDAGEDIFLLDLRGEQEWDTGHIDGARHIYVGNLEKRLSEVPRDKKSVLYCSSGHRSGLGASILLRAGYTNVSHVPGSTTAWKAAGFPFNKD